MDTFLYVISCSTYLLLKITSILALKCHLQVRDSNSSCKHKVQCILSKEKFGLESILFVHLKALRGGEVRGRKSWNGRSLPDPL